MNLSQILKLYGRIAQEQDVIYSVGVGNISASICQGGASKSHSFVDYNEDAVLISIGERATLLALADGHGGALASEFVIDWVGDRLVPDWTNQPFDSRECKDQIAAEVQVLQNELISRQVGVMNPSRTTLVLAVVPHLEGELICVGIGDSEIFLLDSRSSVRSLEQTGLFLGDESQPTLVCKTMTADRSAVQALILASDGISTPGVGFEYPKLKVRQLTHKSRNLLDPGRQAADLAWSIVDEARKAQKLYCAGDNISAVVCFLSQT